MANFTQPNMTTPVDLFIYANTVTGGMFWTLILFATFIISFGTLRSTYSNQISFATTSFFTGILAIFLFILELISPEVMVINMVLAISGVILLLFSKPKT